MANQTNRRGFWRELRTMMFDPLFSPFAGQDAIRDHDVDETEGAPHSVARSIRNANVYWRHYRDNGVIRSSVNEIINALISIPLIAETYEPDDKAWRPLPPDDELSALLTSPSKSVNPAAWYEDYWTGLVVLGNNYVWKHRTRSERIDEFHTLDGRGMFPVPGQDTMIGGFQTSPRMLAGTGEGAYAESLVQRDDNVRYPVSEIIHTRLGVDPAYRLMGLSPFAAALHDIDLDNGITTFITSLMERGAVHDWALISKEPINERESRRIERRWFRRRSGPHNAGGLVVVDGTQAELKQLGMGIGPRDMGLMDLRKQVEARILMALNVPPIVVGAVLGIENATYSNYGQARAAMHEENTDPMLTRACSAFEWSLKDEFPQHRNKIVRVRADLSHVWALLDSVDKRDRLVIAKMEASLISQPEARAGIDMPPLDYVDPFYLVPANYAAQPIIPGQSNVPTTSGDQSNNGNANATAVSTAPQPAGEGERRALTRSLVANYRIDVMRRLGGRARRWGLPDDEATSVAFEAMYQDRTRSEQTPSERAHAMLVAVDELAERKSR